MTDVTEQSFPKHGTCPQVAVYLVRESGQALWNVKLFFDVLFGESNRTFQQVHDKMQCQLPILRGQNLSWSRSTSQFLRSLLEFLQH